MDASDSNLSKGMRGLSESGTGTEGCKSILSDGSMGAGWPSLGGKEIFTLTGGIPDSALMKPIYLCIYFRVSTSVVAGDISVELNGK
jgi:hypothetical protein